MSLAALTEDLDAWHPRTGFHHVRRVLEFSTDLSDSYGESTARVMIHLCNFERPVLQSEFRDEQGSMFVDFFWPRVRVGAEFDGKIKYTRDEFTRGNPAEVVWQEKKRTDRLHRQSVEVERILTSDVKQ